ncbi:MAG: hypothetical protein KF745_11765 [Phycisphaeraceae bacterium]|nr:hypothetical protein [Phycisphaeraceae bacterium]
MTDTPTTQPVRTRSRWRRRLLRLAAVLVILLIALILFAPTLASWLAPGIIERSVNAGIPGKVTVSTVSVGWFSSTRLGPISLADDKGKRIADVSVNSPITVWGLTRTALFGRSHITLPEIVIAGSADVVRNPDGSTNIERALGQAPAKPSPSPAPSPAPSKPAPASSPVETAKASLRLDSLNFTFTDLSAPADAPVHKGLALKDFGGPVAVDYRAGSNGKLNLKSDLSGAFSGGGVPATAEKQKIKTDIALDLSPSGVPIAGSADVDISNVPAALIDVLADLGGTLSPSIGPMVDLKITASGSLDKANAAATLTAASAGIDLAADYNGSRLILSKPARIWTKSTRFLSGVRALRPSLDKAGASVQLDQAPGIDLTISRLDLPLPKDIISGAKPAAPASLDLRLAVISASMKVDAMSGKVAAAPPGPDGSLPPAAWSALKTDPIELVIDSADLNQGIDVIGKTAATIDSKPAGTLSIKAHAAGVLDASGNPTAGLPTNLNANISLAGAATAILQPIVAGLDLPINLAEDLGPTVDAKLTASASGSAGKGGLPPIDAALSLQSDNANANAAVRLEDQVVKTRGDAITLSIRSAGPLVRRFLARGAQPAPEVTGPFGLELTVKDLAAPIDDRASNPAAIAAAVGLKVTDVSFRPAAAAAPSTPLPTNAPGGAVRRIGPIHLTQALTTVSLPGNGDGPKLTLNASMDHESKPFTAEADLALPTFFKHWPIENGDTVAMVRSVNGMRPAGTIKVDKLPGTLAQFAPVLSPPAIPPAPDDLNAQIMELVRAAAAHPTDLVVRIVQPNPPSGPAQTNITLQTTGVAVSTVIDAFLTNDRAVLLKLWATTGIPSGDVQPVLTALSPAGGPPMRLRDSLAATLTVGTLSAPWKPGAAVPVDLTGGTIDATLETKAISLDNVIISGSPRSFGVAQTTVHATAPAAAILGEMTGRAKATLATVLSNLSGPQTGAIATVTADADVQLDKPGAPTLTAALKNLNAAVLDSLLGTGGDVVGALGNSGQVALKVTPAPNDILTIEATADAPRLKSTPIRLTMTPDTIASGGDTKVTWTPDPAWLSTRLFPPVEGDAPADKARLDTTKPVSFDLSLGRIILSRPKSEGEKQLQGPFKPGVFLAGGVLTSPSITVIPGEGRPALTAQDIRASMWMEAAKPGILSADLRIKSVLDAATGEGSQPSALTCSLANYADARGVLTPDAATIDARGDVRKFPSPLLDALAHQGGLLTAALGPVVSLTLQADKASKTGGVIKATATSERATVTLGGSITDATFVQQQPVELKLSEITEALTRELAGSLPVIGTLQKSKEDAPAVIRTEGLTVPLDKDLSKLNGVISVDPGTASFATSGAFQRILKFVGQKQAGVIGQRLNPFVVRAQQGNLNYDRFQIPLGEYTVETTGQVNLVNRTINIVTYAPFFALTDEAAGAFNTNIAGTLGKIIPGNAIDRLTMIPIRTSGSLDNPKTEVDVKQFFEESGKNLLSAPGNLLEGIGNLIDPKKKKDNP